MMDEQLMKSEGNKTIIHALIMNCPDSKFTQMVILSLPALKNAKKIFNVIMDEQFMKSEDNKR